MLRDVLLGFSWASLGPNLGSRWAPPASPPAGGASSAAAPRPERPARHPGNENERLVSLFGGKGGVLVFELLRKPAIFRGTRSSGDPLLAGKGKPNEKPMPLLGVARGSAFFRGYPSFEADLKGNQKENTPILKGSDS